MPQNISSIINIEYAHHSQIATLRINPATSLIEDLTFYENMNPANPANLANLSNQGNQTNHAKSWFRLYFTPQSSELQITAKQSDHGDIYTCSLQARIPKDNPETTSFIRASQNAWFLLRVTDANGIIRLIGTPDFPARLVSKISIPASPAAYNGYDLAFTSRQLSPPAYFPQTP